MERFSLEFQDRVFFERYAELSDKQIRFYLDMRRASRMLSDPQVQEEIRQRSEAGEVTIGIENVDFIMDLKLLCEKGFTIRERTS